MSTTLMSFVIAAVALCTGTLNALGEEGCAFTVSTRQRPQPAVTGPDDVISRLLILEQPDSPVFVAGADFSGFQLNASDGYVSYEGPYTVDIVNRSDKTVHAVHVVMRVRNALAGGGNGRTLDRALAPGERATIVVNGGPGRSTGSFTSDEVRVVVNVEVLRFDLCEYRPSQAIPLPRTR
jgi:hypothetical protein